MWVKQKTLEAEAGRSVIFCTIYMVTKIEQDLQMQLY